MNTLNTLLIETTILLFPLIINLFYCTYSNNIYKEQNKTFLDFALLSSLYLLIIYNNLNTNIMILSGKVGIYTNKIIGFILINLCSKFRPVLYFYYVVMTPIFFHSANQSFYISTV